MAASWLPLILVLWLAVAPLASSSGAGSTGASGRPGMAPGQQDGAPVEDTLGMWLLWPDDVAIAPTFKAAGARWTRVVVAWAQTEPAPGAYAWAAADAAVAAVTAQDFEVIVAVMGNPAWAAETWCGPLYAEHVQTYANFMKAVVARYSVAPYHVRTFELGNEPDNADVTGTGWVGGCWGKGHPNSAAGAGGDAYAAMLKAVYPAMKAADPEVQVVIGGLAHDMWISEGGPFDEFFLDDLLAAGGGAYFDAINFHFYEGLAAKWGGVAGKGGVLQEKVRAATGEWKPLLITELGSPTAKPPGSTDPGVYSEAQQAAFVFKGFAQALSGAISPVLWFQGVDRPDLSGGYAYGLRRADQRKKPGFAAFRTFAGELNGFTYRDMPVYPDVLVEGYRFASAGAQKTVVWRNAAAATAVPFGVRSPGRRVTVTNTAGWVKTITDGAAGDRDGRRNGVVVVAVGPDPVIVTVSTTPSAAGRPVGRTGGPDIASGPGAAFLTAPPSSRSEG